jgi:hypothetical protein
MFLFKFFVVLVAVSAGWCAADVCYTVVKQRAVQYLPICLLFFSVAAAAVVALVVLLP